MSHAHAAFTARAPTLCVMAGRTADDTWLTKLQAAASERRVEREDGLRREWECDARLVEALRREAPTPSPR